MKTSPRRCLTITFCKSITVMLALKATYSFQAKYGFIENIFPRKFGQSVSARWTVLSRRFDRQHWGNLGTMPRIQSGIFSGIILFFDPTLDIWGPKIIQEILRNFRNNLIYHSLNLLIAPQKIDARRCLGAASNRPIITVFNPNVSSHFLLDFAGPEITHFTSLEGFFVACRNYVVCRAIWLCR